MPQLIHPAIYNGRRRPTRWPNSTTTPDVRRACHLNQNCGKLLNRAIEPVYSSDGWLWAIVSVIVRLAAHLGQPYDGQLPKRWDTSKIKCLVQLLHGVFGFESTGKW